MSVTISGLIATILALVFEPNEVSIIVNWIDSTLLVAGIIAVYYGRFRQGDITWYGKKK